MVARSQLFQLELRKWKHTTLKSNKRWLRPLEVVIFVKVFEKNYKILSTTQTHTLQILTCTLLLFMYNQRWKGTTRAKQKLTALGGIHTLEPKLHKCKQQYFRF